MLIELNVEKRYGFSVTLNLDIMEVKQVCAKITLRVPFMSGIGFEAY